MNLNDAILIPGGYGVVGQQIIQIVHQRHPDLHLVLAGRNPEKAEPLIRNLSNVSTVKLDLERPNPLQKFHGKPGAILAVVNDNHDYLLFDAVQAGIPYLDITRWTERVRLAMAREAVKSSSSPVIFASAWMAGVAVVVAAAAARKLHLVDTIDINVLYSLKDKAGPDSAAYMDRLSIPYSVKVNGKQETVYPMSDSRTVTFPGGYRAKTYRFDTPDQLTLPDTLGVKTVAARLAFDDSFSNWALVALVRSGIWKLFNGERFTGLRRSILFNPGEGGSHEIIIELCGIDRVGQQKSLTATIADPKGQTHLTALGATIQLERLLGLDGAPAPAAGIIFPETTPQLDAALKLLNDFGVSVAIG